jgi:hypothetical protein
MTQTLYLAASLRNSAARRARWTPPSRGPRTPEPPDPGSPLYRCRGQRARRCAQRNDAAVGVEWGGGFAWFYVFSQGSDDFHLGRVHDSCVLL